jgi:hypothetical protein
LLGGQGRLQLIATASGALLVPVTGQDALDPSAIQGVGVDERAGRFYVATDSGLWALDDHSGRVERVLALTAAPVAVAVDAATHRLFVLQAGRHVPSGGDGSAPLLRWLRQALPWLALPAPPRSGAAGTLMMLDTTRL